MTFTRLTRDVEIGANCYALDLAGRRIVLDCGLHPQLEGRAALPQLDLIAPHSVDAIVLTHAHQDHLGSMPVLQRLNPEAPVFTSEATKQLGTIMLHNSVNVMLREREAGVTEYPLFTHREVDQSVKRWRPLPLEMRFSVEGDRLGQNGEADVSLEFFDAGHILGSVGVRIVAEGRSIFYTGDVQFEDQSLSRAATFPTEPVDVLIMETTRGDRAAEAGWTREAEEQRLATALAEVFAQGGAVLIPTFALGKTQEILTLIHRFRRQGVLRQDCPIYIGGLGAKITEVHDKLAGQTRRHQPNLRLLDEVAPFVISGQSADETPLKPQRIYALSSGMMTEHTISNVFARRLISDPKHAIFFVGYCDPEAPGGPVRSSELGEFVKLSSEHPAQPRECRIERFNFSGHASRESLRAYAVQVRPKKILLVHGDPDAANWFREALRADLPDTEVLIPAPGETVEF